MTHYIHVIGHVAKFSINNGVATFSVASNDVRRDTTTWFRCVLFGKLAQVAKSRIRKGTHVYVRGQLMPDPETGCPRVYESTEGEHRANHEMRVEQFDILKY